MIRWLWTTFGLLAVLGAAVVHAAPQPRHIRDVLGVTHVDGRYHLTDKDYLNEGADQLLALGTRVIKFYMEGWEQKYPYNSRWPKVHSLVELAQSPHYRDLFNKPFTTHIATVYAFGRPMHYWRGGVTPEQAADEERQMYELTRHFLTTYRNTGKTFVLQHWEGDWAVRGNYERKKDPTPQELAGMVAWLKARQSGVNRARAEFGQQGVRVLHAAEVNLVRDCMEKGRPGVANHVLPNVELDLVSYSAYDTQDDPKLFRAALEYIAKNMAGKADGCRVYVGEFGRPENAAGLEKVKHTVRTVMDVARDFGCPYIVYWQLYCNEPIRQPVKRNEDTKGFWLIKPDGSKAWTWDYFHAILTKG